MPIGEATIGKWFTATSRHTSIFLATKWAGSLAYADSRPSTLRRGIEASLARLQTDYIDLFYQHRVEPFELADSTKSGRRRILALFLIDPSVRVLSTTDVPPQQADWALDEVGKASVMGKLPQELYDMVLGYTAEGLMSREEAERHRALLMEERSNFVHMHNEEVFEVEFNMCEH